MRVTIKKSASVKEVSRTKKKLRIRRKITGSAEKPRLSIFRSARHMYAQIIDDSKGVTLVSASTLDVDGLKGSNKTSATGIGKEIAKRALAKNIKEVVFDRNGYLFHGRIKSLADGAREAGLKF